MAFLFHNSTIHQPTLDLCSEGNVPYSRERSVFAVAQPSAGDTHWEVGNGQDEFLLTDHPTTLVKTSNEDFLLNANHWPIH